MRGVRLPAAAFAIVVAYAPGISADDSGHGPVFGMTTPTNARGAWALDFGLMGRSGSGDSGLMTRTMVSYGVTEDLQISGSVPLVFASAPFAPARGTAMMPGSGDVEAIGAWRFHRRGTAVGTRVESTVYGGLIVPGPQKPAGMARDLKRAPGVYVAAATGFASRSHYLWAGLGFTRFAERGGDGRPDILSYSTVWGYRPPSLRKEYPHWDWRCSSSSPASDPGISGGPVWNTRARAGTKYFLAPRRWASTRTTRSKAECSSRCTEVSAPAFSGRRSVTQSTSVTSFDRIGALGTTSVDRERVAEGSESWH